MSLKLEDCKLWDFCLLSTVHIDSICWMGFKFTHRLCLTLPDLASHFLSPVHLRGRTPAHPSSGRGCLLSLQRTPERARSVGVCHSNSECSMGLGNRVHSSFQGRHRTSEKSPKF